MSDTCCELLAYEARATSRTAMLGVVQQLVEEFTGLHQPAHVIRQAYRTREALLADGVRFNIVEATLAATRRRLRDSRTLVTLSG
jgi:hypothetical protein